MIMGQFSCIAFLVLVISLQSARSVPLVARTFFQPNQNRNFNQLFSNGQAVDQNGNPIFQPQNQNPQFFPNGQQNQNFNNFNQFFPNGQQNQNLNNFNQFFPNGQAVDQNGNPIFQPQNQNGFGQFGQNAFFQNNNVNDQSGTNPFFGNPDSLQPGQDPNILEDMGLEQGQRGNGGDPCHATDMAEPENDYGTTGVCGRVRDPDNPGKK